MLISTPGSNHHHRWFWLLSQSTVLLLLLLLLYSGFSDQHPVQQQQSQPQPQQGQRQSHQFESSTLQNSAAQLSRINDVEIVDNVDNRVPYYQQPNNIIVNHNNHNDPDDGNLPEHFDERRRDIPAGNSSDCVKQVLIVDTSVINNPTNLINRRVPLVSSQSQQFQPQVAPPRQLPQSHQAVQSGHQTPQIPPIYIQTVPPQHPQVGLSQGHQQQQQPINVSHSTSSTTIQVQINSSSTTSTTTIQPQRPNVLMPKLESTGRPACVESPDDTFCEIVDNYPKAAIKSEINFSPEQFGEIFGSKEIDGRKSYSDDDMGEEGVCRKFPKVIYPQMAKNQANQWVYVVNEVEYTQAVVAEVCEKQGKACAYLDQNLPPGMYSRCKQKYSYKRLLALHPTEKRTYPDAFKFPSCCSCYVKFDDFARSGLGRKLQSQVPVVDTSAKRQSPSPDNRQQNNDTVDRNQNQSPNESTLVFNKRNQEQPSEVQPHRNQTSITTRRRHRTSTLQPTISEQSYTTTITTTGTRTKTKQFDP